MRPSKDLCKTRKIQVITRMTKGIIGHRYAFVVLSFPASFFDHTKRINVYVVDRTSFRLPQIQIKQQSDRR